MIKGEIHYVLRDATTEETVAEHKQENIVTEYMYDMIRNDQRIENGLAITTASMEPCRWNRYMPYNVNGVITRYPDAKIPSTTSQVEFFAANGSTPAFIQWSGRFNPPTVGTSREIRSIALCWNLYSQSRLDDPAYAPSYPPTAFSKLSSPCTQTDTQVMDVYYRVFFPTDSNSQMPSWLQASILDRYRGSSWSGSSGSHQYGFHRMYPFPIPNVKPGDEDLFPVSSKAHHKSPYNRLWVDANTVGSIQRRAMVYTPDFNNAVGWVISSVSSGQHLPQAYCNYTNFPKIQNLIGHGTAALSGTSTPFLDVDNLPNGTGKIQLGGDWNNRETPSTPGLYYKVQLPEWNSIDIMTSGAVGVSQYKYATQKFFGFHTTQDGIKTYYPYVMLPSLSSHRTGYDAHKSLLGDIETEFNVRQISSCAAYDETSLIMVKLKEILLYSIGAGEYWRFKSTFQEIHQVAVLNKKIYVACRATGLYVIDPVNSSEVTKIVPPEGIDFSACHGVARGYNNSIWAVAANGLVHFDGTNWTKYDATSSHPFVMAGISDGNWVNVDYLVVDEASPTYEMLLIRRPNAPVDTNKLGVWWSTATAATNTADAIVSGFGRPRINRRHSGALKGMWAFLMGNNLRVCAFGANTWTLAGTSTMGTSYASYKSGHIHHSVVMVETPSGQPRAMVQWENRQTGYSSIDSNRNYATNLKLVDVTGTVTDSIESSLAMHYYDMTDLVSSAPARTSVDGYQDQSACFILDKGVMAYVYYHVGDGSSNLEGVAVSISNYGHTLELSGGPLAWLGKRTYGWDGSNWVEGHAAAKPTHTSEELLLDGVTVKFTDGASGTSFVTPNYYKFGLVEGLLKDNATRARLSNTFYYRGVRKDTMLTSNVVPAPSGHGTGQLGVDVARSSGGAFVNGIGEIVLPGDNARQAAVSDKQLSGDFLIDFDVTNVNTAATKRAAVFGVGRINQGGRIQYGFVFSSNELYVLDNNTTSRLRTATEVPLITSMQMRRVGTTLQLLVNGVTVHTSGNAQINAGHKRLDFIWNTWDHSNPQWLLGGTNCPKTTVVSNGTDNAVFFGDPNAKTGAFHPRFYSIDMETPGATTVEIDGVPAVIKVDGTEPSPGEVLIDTRMGCMYFNVADQGKTLTAKYTYLQSA